MLEGKRILVLEDEPLVAMLLEEMLLDLGCQVVGPAYSLREGERLANEAELDAAVLDVNVNGEMSDPVANALKARGIPFALATGYGLSAPMAADGRVPVLQKPYPGNKLEETLRELLGG